jgi:tRNA(Ile)-lysidine synthase
MSEGTEKLIQEVGQKLLQWGFSPVDSRLLVAVSGGRDSMLLWKILDRLNYTFEIAHVHYGLRVDEARADARFVEELAKAEGRKFHLLEASELIKNRKGKNVQSAAREVRYDWFEELKEATGFAAVLTAHHEEDQAETFLLQLLRGSGGKGLSGMDSHNTLISRPLLGVSGYAMQQAAQDLALVWREDSSNSEVKYRRNYVRKVILPELKQLNPEASHILSETCKRLKTEQNLLKYFIEKSGLIDENIGKSVLRIDKQKLLELPETSFVLFHFLNEFGFSWSICEQIASNLTKTQELTYQVGSWKATANRSYISVFQNITEVTAHENLSNWEVKTEIITEVADYKNKTPQNEVFLSIDILDRKLSLRNAQKGDYFYPSGMLGKKKISDYFKDQKMDSEAKNEQLLLCVDEEIAWVVNRRIDRRFEPKVEESEAVRVTLVNKNEQLGHL